MRQLAAVSHFRAQKPGLLSFLSERPIQHMVYTRVADDTNLWLKPQEVADEEDADHDQRETGRSAKSGSNKKKCHQLMALLQRLSFRRFGEPEASLHTIQLHSPAQVLPKVRVGFIRPLIGCVCNICLCVGQWLQVL